MALSQNSVFRRVISLLGASDLSRIWMVMPVGFFGCSDVASERAMEKYLAETWGEDTRGCLDFFSTV